MKTAMKKLLSLALAVMLLVSAVPLMASAASDNITVKLKFDGKDQNTQYCKPNNGSDALAQNLVTYYVDKSKIPAGYELTCIWSKSKGAYVEGNATISVGDTVTVLYEPGSNTGSGESGSGESGSGESGSGESGNGGNSGETGTGSENKTITMKLLFNESQTVSKTLTHKPDNGTSSTIRNLLTYVYDGDWADTYNFYRANNKRLGTVYDLDTEVLAGETINIRLKSKSADPINIVVKVNNSDNIVWTGSKVPANNEYATVANLLTYCWNGDWDNTYTFDHAWSNKQQSNIARTGYIYAGDTVYIMVTRGSSTNSGSSNSGSSSSTSGNTADISIDSDYENKANTNTVTLRVIVNNDLNNIRNINITNYVPSTGILGVDDAERIVRQYYTNQDGKNLIVDGLYINKDNPSSVDYILNNRYDYVSGIKSAWNVQDVVITVYLRNAKLKSTSSSTADSSNPKTGDSIYMAVTVLGLSAASLAAVYYVSKKRAIR